MNFLAHAFLSGSDDDVLIGNFIADAIKGNNSKDFREGIQKGILLHREIDSFTDNHPVFLKSCKRIQNKYAKFSGVVVDIYYDHFLAANWHDYSDEDLSEFAIYVYTLMLQNYAILPPRSRRILPFMVIHNWLVGYSRFSDLQWVFNGMSRRSKQYNSGLEDAVKTLQANYEKFEQDFRSFFPDLVEASAGFREKLLCS